jgi:hypothetical protein
MTDTNDSYRRTVLRTVGAVGALFGVSGVASAGGKTDGHDHDHDHDHDDDDDDDDLKAPTPAEAEEDVGEETSIRFDAQVTDGTYVVAEDVVVPTAGFLSIHQSNTEIDGEQYDYINTEDGSPQNAAQTIVGFSEYLEPGIYDEVKVPIYQDDDLPPVAASGQHRLEDPAVLLALMHVDGNDNEEWDLFDNEDIVDAAYDFGDTEFAPPFDRPDDVAAVVPLEENEDVFEIYKDH